MAITFYKPVGVSVQTFAELNGICIFGAGDTPQYAKTTFFADFWYYVEEGPGNAKHSLTDAEQDTFLNNAIVHMQEVAPAPQVQVQGLAGAVFGEAIKPIDNWNVAPKPKKNASPEPQVKLLAVGADVEQFLRDKKTGNPVPCIQLIGGTKIAPIPILDHVEPGFALQEDNVMLEYNIPPARSAYEFSYNIKRIQEEIGMKVKGMGLVPAIESSMRFTEEQLDHEQARVFGCEPDFNAWTRTENPSPKGSEEIKTLRTAGAHIHISFSVDGKECSWPEHIPYIEAIVMGLDLKLGVPSILLDRDKDRRKMYGKAGAFRHKPYGLEYRVMSNWWTKKPEYTVFVYEIVQSIFKGLNRSGVEQYLASLKQMQEQIVHIINAGDEVQANKMRGGMGLQMPQERV
jgi:hypothetical protein